MSGPADQTEGLWITSDPTDDGRYQPVLSVDGDRSWSLTPKRCIAYGLTVLEVAARAEYEEAVYAQLTATGVEEAATLELIGTLRAKRLPVDDTPTLPLRFVHGLNQAGKAFVRLELDGAPCGQIDADAARHHALHVMEQASACQLDRLYRRALRDVVGLEDERAQAVVSSLASHRPGADQ